MNALIGKNPTKSQKLNKEAKDESDLKPDYVVINSIYKHDRYANITILHGHHTYRRTCSIGTPNNQNHYGRNYCQGCTTMSRCSQAASNQRAASKLSVKPKNSKNFPPRRSTVAMPPGFHRQTNRLHSSQQKEKPQSRHASHRRLVLIWD
ncbi:hypothetical protein TNCV_892061 [Trichonephila clavipes]|nr:hypothetical protein TNCV_892061 [Trichonephila clavipes]